MSSNARAVLNLSSAAAPFSNVEGTAAPDLDSTEREPISRQQTLDWK